MELSDLLVQFLGESSVVLPGLCDVRRRVFVVRFDDVGDSVADEFIVLFGHVSTGTEADEIRIERGRIVSSSIGRFVRLSALVRQLDGSEP